MRCRHSLSASLRIAAELAVAAAHFPAVASEPSADILRVAREVRTSSFPELAGEKIRFRSFDSKSDYFQSRPALRGYTILINDGPELLNAPPDAIRAILAHELEHVCYYRSRSRIRLIGLIRLLRNSSDARWERATDMRTISRGFGPGLREYRLWLYNHVPPAAAKRKKRIYMTPEEISAAMREKVK